MTSGAGILWFVIGIGLMLLAHEAGHFLTAKRFGMKAEAFFMGFGPKLFSFTRGETEYGVRLLPLGGYVKISGMNPFADLPEEDRGRTFGAKPAWQRAVVLAAGSLSHLILAFAVFLALFVAVGLPSYTLGIGDVRGTVNGRTSPALKAGLKKGDRVIAVNRVRVRTTDDAVDLISSSPGRPITITIQRAGRRMDLRAVPASVAAEVKEGPKTVGKMGVVLTMLESAKPVSPPRAAAEAFRETGRLVAVSAAGAKQFFFDGGIAQAFKSLGGQGERKLAGGEAEPVSVVGAGRLAGQAAQEGIFGLTYTILSVIVFIGVINLVPLPPLDGGYLAVLLWEKIRGRRVDLRKLVPVGVVVAGFFLILMIALVYLDIARPIQNPY